MATSSSKKSACVTCGKGSGTFTCRGCAQDFCLIHASEHRQLLGKQMDEDIIFLHDQLQNSLNAQVNQPTIHPLMKEINEWEKQSIEKIRKKAEESRVKVLRLVKSNTDKLKTTLTSIKQELSKARDEDNFFESDLNEWKQKLEQFRKDLNTPETIIITHDDRVRSFVPEISITEQVISSETFEIYLGNVQIQDNGKLIVHGNTDRHSAARGKGQYSSGRHCFHFKIEKIGSSKWVLFGIVSKGAPIQEYSYSTPTTYGWAGGNQVYFNGVCNTGYNGYKTDMETNYIFELTIDCDKRKIYLKNERTNSAYELDVDVTKCPFPWQLSVNIYNSGDILRLLA